MDIFQFTKVFNDILSGFIFNKYSKIVQKQKMLKQKSNDIKYIKYYVD